MTIKTTTIKSKGIALTSKSSNYSANNRPVSLLMKSDLDPSQVTMDIVKALRQVTVEMSFEEFLRKFMCMYSCDAELLAKLLGYQTELEAEVEENPNDLWLQEWNTAHQEYLEEKASAITLMKSAKPDTEFTAQEQYDILKLQSGFETGVKEFGITFDDKGNIEKSQITGTQSSVKNTQPNKEESTVTDVKKAQEVLDLEKQLADMKAEIEKANAKAAEAEEIIKAATEVKKAEALEKAKGFSFAEEADHEAVAEFLFKAANSAVVEVLEKAQKRISELETEIEDVKKQFGEAEHGSDAQVSTADIKKSAEDILRANIEAFKSRQKA